MALISSKGTPIPTPCAVCVQVEFTREGTETFHKTECDHYTMRYEYLRNFSYEK